MFNGFQKLGLKSQSCVLLPKRLTYCTKLLIPPIYLSAHPIYCIFFVCLENNRIKLRLLPKSFLLLRKRPQQSNLIFIGYLNKVSESYFTRYRNLISQWTQTFLIKFFKDHDLRNTIHIHFIALFLYCQQLSQLCIFISLMKCKEKHLRQSQ